MTVNPDVVDLYTRQKYENAPKNAKKQHFTENQMNPIKFKCQLKGTQFLHLACQGGGSPPCPPSVTSLRQTRFHLGGLGVATFSTTLRVYWYGPWPLRCA